MQYSLISQEEQCAIKLIAESEIDFPVNFDDAWKWIGYSSKQKAKDKLVRNFEKDMDYRLNQMVETKQDGSFSHRWELIEVSIECFKQLAMMAQTEKGKEVRLYFLECEKELKALKSNNQLTHSVPKNLGEALRLAADLYDQKEKLAAENIEQKKVIKEAKPKLRTYEAVMSKQENHLVREAAKILGIRIKALKEFLRDELHIFTQHGDIYSQFINRGYFKMKLHEYERKYDYGTSTTFYITNKGIEWIRNNLVSKGWAHGLELDDKDLDD